MALKYQHYPDASEIPNHLLREIFERQIIAWWEKPFSEYKICTNTSCGRIYSIEDVHGSVSNMAQSGDDFCCIEDGCWSSTDYVYKSEEFFQAVQEYVQHNVSMVLLTTQQDELKGFWVLSQWTIDSVVKGEFATRESYDVDLLIKKLSTKLFWRYDAADERVICFHQIFIDADTRKEEPDAAFNLLRELFFVFSEDFYDIPVVGETRFDIKFYAISRALWFENIMPDEHGYTVQGIQRYAEILEYLRTHPSITQMFPAMFKYMKEAKRILKENPWLSWKKHYK